MNAHPFIRTIALFLAVAFIAPSAFFVAPSKAQAQWATWDAANGIQNALTIAQNALIEVHAFTSMIADVANWVNTFVLQPLAFVLSGNLMKVLTASVVKFVIGTANGTGVPQFVVGVQKSIQTLSDMKARAYLSQMNLTGSPFASSIASALGLNYSYGSSLGGYWAANLCTLRASSPNITAYLNGNWSQGGVAAWLALTTQVQNNPYTLYLNSQAQLANVIGPGVGGATGARLAELTWGQGMMSWCGTSDAATQTQAAAQTAFEACIANKDNTPAYCDKVFANSGGVVGGINPGDPCTKTDGSGESGTIQTPGSVIKATLDKVLGGQQDKLVMMGNISSQITGILSDIGKIMQTVQFASSILGSNNGSTGGLLGAGSASGALNSYGNQPSSFAPTQDASGNFTSGYGAVTGTTINQGAANSSVIGAVGNDLSSRVNMYKTGWNTIGTAANTAKTKVTSLINTCTTNVGTAKTQLASASDFESRATLQAFIDTATIQASSAQSALTTEVNPVITKASNAIPIVTAILAMNDKVQKEIGTSSYAADFQTLMTMPPTADDALNAQQDALVSDKAVADPEGSLKIVPSTTAKFVSLVDQMNLISTNATALELSACAIPATGGGGGNGVM